MVAGSRSLVAVRTGAGGPVADGEVETRSILMVAPSWPYPPTWGFATRVFQLATQLARHHRVTLLAFGVGSAARAQLDSGSVFESVELVPHPASVRNKRRAQLASLLSPRSFHLGTFRSAEMQSALTRLLARERFDLVQIESSQMGYLQTPGHIPVVLDEHNIEFLLLRRLAAIESSLPRKAFSNLEAAKARREEMQAWTRCDGAVLTSAADLSAVHALMPQKPACVVPNGVDTEYFKPSPVDVEPKPSTVVFTGAINYRPNTDAVVYFIREVLPQLKRLRPSVRFVVVGRGAPDWLVRMGDESVQFTGAVDDVRPYVQRAAVVVAPLRAGSGTRLKILEALAMGKPVVTTSIGCEGLSVADGEHLKIADGSAALAAETERLLSDPRGANELGRRGRELAVREYSWHVIATRLDQFHGQLLTKETRV